MDEATRPGFDASEAIAHLLAITPERWCWTMGYHPTHAALAERDPGHRRLTLSLLLPEEPGKAPGWRGEAPRIYEEMTVRHDGASYLTLARRAVTRGLDHAAGRNVGGVRDNEWASVQAAESAATELLRAARRNPGGIYPIDAATLVPAAMLIRLGLAVAEDTDHGVFIRLTEAAMARRA